MHACINICTGQNFHVNLKYNVIELNSGVIRGGVAPVDTTQGGDTLMKV